MNTVIQKLIDKGFNGADIHFFLQRFDIGIDVPPPPNMNYVWGLPLGVSAKEQQRRWNEHYEFYAKIRRQKWEQANIAADYERHR